MDNSVVIITSKRGSLTTMNSGDDPSALRDNEAQLIENFLLDEGSLVTRKGWSKVDSSYLASQTSIGKFRSLSGDVHYVAVAGGSLYAGTSFPLSLKLTGLSTGVTMQMIPYRGYMLINDPLKGVICYDGSTAEWCGVPSPRVYLSIETFESTSGWTTSSGSGTASLVSYNATQGNYSLKLKAGSGSNWTVYKMFSGAIDLTSFPPAPTGDGTSSTVLDFIRFVLTRSASNLFDQCTLYIYTASDRSSYYYITLSSLKEWFSTSASGVTIDFAIRKSAFSSSGTPSWSTVWGIGFNIDSATGYQPYIICDFMRLEKSGPVARELCTIIADMEANETWTEATPSVGFDSTYFKTLSRSMTLNGAGARAYRDVSLDLTLYDTGEESDPIDSIEFSVARDSTKGNSTSRYFEVRLYTSTSPLAFYYYTINAGQIKTPQITTTTYKKITSPDKVFTTFAIPKSAFSSEGSTSGWSSITRVEVTDGRRQAGTSTPTDTSSGTWYVDSIRVVRTIAKRVVFDIEATASSETISISDTETSKKSGWNDIDKAGDVGKVRTDEGSRASYSLKISANTTVSFTVSTSSDIDCSVYPDAFSTQAQDTDLLGPWLWFSSTKNIKSIDILFSLHDSNFTYYYIKTIDGASLPTLTNDWFDAHIPRSEYESYAGSYTWANVRAMRVTISTGKTGAEICVDRCTMYRAKDVSGSYTYRVVYKNRRGARSNYSNYSNIVSVTNASVLLTNIPSSSGCVREIERIGGSVDSWHVVGEISDDETTFFRDDMVDESIGPISLNTEYSRPYAANAMAVYKDVVVLGGLTSPDGASYPCDVMVTREYSIDEVDYNSVFSLGKDDGHPILALVCSFDKVYALKERGIYAFDPYNLQQTPVQISRDLGIISTHSFTSFDGGFTFLSTDRNIYLYNGASFENISRPFVSDYLESVSSGDIRAVYWNNYSLYRVSSSTILCFYHPTSTWTIITGWDVVGWWADTLSTSNYLYAAASNGYVYVCFDSDSDDGTQIVARLKSREVSTIPPAPSTISTILLMCSAESGVPSIKIEPYLDGSPSNKPLVISLDNPSFSRCEIKASDSLYWHTFSSILLTATSRLRIKHLSYVTRDESPRT